MSRLTQIISCIMLALVLSNCKSMTADTQLKDVQVQLDVICSKPQPLGTYTEDTRYLTLYAMPKKVSEVPDFCQPSPGECNKSSPIKGRAVCEDATELKVCPEEHGSHPVLCYPAIKD